MGDVGMIGGIGNDGEKVLWGTFYVRNFFMASVK